MTTIVTPSEEPILSPQDEASELAFSTIVRRLDVPVIKEEIEPTPLPVEITQRLPERRLGRRLAKLVVDPRTKRIQQRSGLRVASDAPLFRGVASEQRVALDREDGRDEPQPVERDLIAGPSRFDEATCTPTSKRTATSTRC